MKKITIYAVIWDNGHASDLLSGRFTSKVAASQYGREWKRDMVNLEHSPQACKEAREQYSWELATKDYWVQRNFEWPGHSWSAYLTENPVGSSPIGTECPYRHILTCILKHSEKNW